MKEVYQQTKRELFEKYGSASGHSEENAKELLLKCGENALEEKGKKSFFRVFLEQFADLLVIILIVAAIISMLSGNVESTIVIFAVIILVVLWFCLALRVGSGLRCSAACIKRRIAPSSP